MKCQNGSLEFIIKPNCQIYRYTEHSDLNKEIMGLNRYNEMLVRLSNKNPFLGFTENKIIDSSFLFEEFC